MEREIEKISDQEEVHWAQRSRVNQLKHGDRNSNFFHSSATNRRRKNFIKELYKNRGEWCEDDQGMTDTAMDYFDNIFSSSNLSQVDIDYITFAVDPVVDVQMNQSLCAPFTSDDIKRAVFDMHPSKAPGPDEFTTLFYQKLWPIVVEAIVRAALSILN